jgi:hypothetical protein
VVLQRGFDTLDVALPERVDELGHDLRGDLVGLAGTDLPGGGSGTRRCGKC